MTSRNEPKPTDSSGEIDKRTVRDFGDQWTRYTENDGHYASIDMLRDIVEPLLPAERIEGARVMDIGSGSGRIVNMLLAAGAAHVTAVEPSGAVEVLRQNVAHAGDKVRVVRAMGHEAPADADVDIVVSIGVLHHIVDPAPVVAAGLAALRPGGVFFAWLYGHEGNELYLAVFGTLRKITTRMPDFLLRGFCHSLTIMLSGYVTAAKFLPLPMRDYCRSVLGKYPYRHLYLTVFDQLNPAYAKYYYEHEARALLERTGLVDVRVFHRHGYSWAVIGTAPNR